MALLDNVNNSDTSSEDGEIRNNDFFSSFSDTNQEESSDSEYNNNKCQRFIRNSRQTDKFKADTLLIENSTLFPNVIANIIKNYLQDLYEEEILTASRYLRFKHREKTNVNNLKLLYDQMQSIVKRREKQLYIYEQAEHDSITIGKLEVIRNNIEKYLIREKYLGRNIRAKQRKTRYNRERIIDEKKDLLTFCKLPNCYLAIKLDDVFEDVLPF